ncbi:FecR family protein [Pedobacter foliorum]|uniref:FecR family protein n=1 Tax=Pedobacter foliorum TaxID=2739058 RepID=UPI001566F80E|nr:FecR family protein [Pedobacter foliorum]NRF41151.1 FecR family protein [Pedobacter foliorum]
MNNEIIHLFTKYLNNQCSEDELERVFMLIEKGSNKSEWDFVLAEEASRLVGSSHQAEMSLDEIARLHDKIQDTIKDDHKIEVLPVRNWYWSKIAAAAVILVTLSVGVFYYSKQDVKSDELAHDIAPGGNKAILTLANGKKIVLTDAKNGMLAADPGVSVTKLADGKIIYALESGNVANAAFNNIETPRGGQYQVILPDGSKVSLNAASSLTYPASFATLKERRVELKGEAYFEVAKDKKHPFIVKTENQEIKVLGTHFNINSYTDEPMIKTTLIEGSVLVKASGMEQILKPGYQAVNGIGGLRIVEANVDEVLAWKNGYFMFDSEGIESVMRKISRWYNVDVVFKGNVSKDKFGGTVSRFENVSQVLRKLEYTDKVHFIIEERRIIVTK